jgi:hypothetical protein
MPAPRGNPYEAAPEATNVLRAVEAYLHQPDDKELVDPTGLIGMIDLWSRLAISLCLVHPVEAAA